MNIGYPFNFDGHGRVQTVDDPTHVRQLIEQVLFTNPGERVNRPDFGSGLLQMVFAGNSDALAAALHASVSASLQRWLGDLIDVRNLEVEHEDSQLRVTVVYALQHTGEARTATFEREVA